MATGMPVICNQHSTAPVINEKSGFMSSDVTYLREKIAALEVNEELARQLGHEARRYVMTNHSLEQFDKRWMEVLDLAIRRYQERGASSANAKSP
jgi:glycosyltransferase involved in cell wall biosynthesis